MLSFKSIFNFSGDALAGVTEFEAWKLDEGEAVMLAEQADQVTMELFPQITGKLAKILIFAVSIIGVFGTRWIKYEAHRAKLRREENSKKAKKENGNDNFVIVDNV